MTLRILLADDHQIVRQGLSALIDKQPGMEVVSPLSGREREVLQLLAEGRSTREIAERLFLSPKTVGSHRERIMRKLGIDSVAGLTKYAIRHGLTGSERDPAG